MNNKPDLEIIESFKKKRFKQIVMSLLKVIVIVFSRFGNLAKKNSTPNFVIFDYKTYAGATEELGTFLEQ